MKQKTAMMELIEYILNNGMHPDCGVPDIKLKAEQLLEKEKEQIIDLAIKTTMQWSDYDRLNYGVEYINKRDGVIDFVEKHFNSTYKQD